MAKHKRIKRFSLSTPTTKVIPVFGAGKHVEFNLSQFVEQSNHLKGFGDICAAEMFGQL